MSDMYKVTEVLSKIFQIICFIGAVGTLIIGIFLFASKDPMNAFDMEDRLINACGMAVYVYEPDSEVAAHVIGAMNFVYSVLLVLLGMIFRNVSLIAGTAKGKTWFSKGETPFQEDVVRMVREIGIFLIAIYIVGLIGTLVARLISENVESSNTMVMLVIGIIVICLSKIFEYGQKLEEDQEGLI